jgi:enamine deaminase RidA (YjgF/YER057c/UK114 family)
MIFRKKPKVEMARASQRDREEIYLTLKHTWLCIPMFVVPFDAAEAGTRQAAQIIFSNNPGLRKIQDQWGFADAVVVGDTIYLSGVVAGLQVGETDLKLPYERAFKLIGTTLERAGANWDDVVDITSFHTDLTTQLPAMIAVKNKYVRPPAPAWTAIQVSRLIPDNGLTEIKIVAKLYRRAP